VSLGTGVVWRTHPSLCLQRDLALLKSLGFSTVLCQKALFVSSGVHAEAMHWLLRHQHHPNADVPWNMGQLQVSGWQGRAPGLILLTAARTCRNKWPCATPVGA